MLQQVATVDDLVALIPLDRVQTDECLDVFGGITAARAALAMARVHKHLGNDSLAMAFASQGLRHVGCGKAEFRDLKRS